MNTSMMEAAPAARGTSFLWKLALILFPVLVAIALFSIWQSETQRLSRRQLANAGQVPRFELTSEKGTPFGTAQLQGKIWIADFIFTNCPGPCAMISSRMSELQKPLEETDVQLVSFSVDPVKDTPEVLRGYAQKLKADPQRWNFLTGPVATIYDLSRNGFKLAVAEGGEADGGPVHSTRMALVDRKGTIRGYYEATSADGLTKLIADTRQLLREQPR